MTVESRGNRSVQFPESFARSNEVLAWLQRPDFETIPELNTLGRERLVQITGSDDIISYLSAVEQVRMSRMRDILNILVSGFSKRVVLELIDKRDIHTAVKLLRGGLVEITLAKRIGDISDEDFEAIIDELTDHEATAEALKYLREDTEWARRMACRDVDESMLLQLGGRGDSVRPEARLLCHSCMVRLYCLKQAIAEDATAVVRAGLGDKEREIVAMQLRTE